MANSLLLQAFEGTNKTTPVWFMRQAGRYIPEYQTIRKKYSLEEMFTNPEIAAEVTCLPISILNVDAAILFADILSLPSQMGFDIRFEKNNGPVISNPIARLKDLDKIHDFAGLSYIEQTIRLVNERLPKNIPLIGFAGSPFTVLTYLIEGGASINFNKTLQFAYQYPSAFHKLLTILTRNTILYLHRQKKAGVKIFQLFDTWAGILRPADYAHWVLPYVQEIFKKVNLPSIYYLKNSRHLLALMDQCGADFLSVCHSVVLGHNSVLEKTARGIQGNLFNGLLYADEKTLEKEIQDVLLGAGRYKKYIFNLSHGVFADIEVAKLKFVVENVHRFQRPALGPSA